MILFYIYSFSFMMKIVVLNFQVFLRSQRKTQLVCEPHLQRRYDYEFITIGKAVVLQTSMNIITHASVCHHS